MRNLIRNTVLGALAAVMSLPALGSAQTEPDYHNRELGEQSIGTAAPTRDDLMTAIRTAAPGRLITMLEYAERVECHACVPLLQAELLENNDPEVREAAAWWLRHRIFGLGAVVNSMRTVLANDEDPVRRTRAAEALGMFHEPSVLPYLSEASANDSAESVRAAAVGALGELNHIGGNPAIAAALADASPAVRYAAISQVLLVNGFVDHDALVAALGDSETMIRMRAARLVGEMRVDAAVPVLAGMLRGDAEWTVRQAAAWALGRIGGADASTALTEAFGAESNNLVLDAIRIARAM